MNESLGGDSSAAKSALRDQILAARRRRPLSENAALAADFDSTALSWDDLRRAATVAAYVSVGSEPGTGLLLDSLVAAGKRVLLPVLRSDNDLDWAAYGGPAGIVKAARGLMEPSGARLGVDAVRTADLVLVPGLAVSGSGERLGRGGGSYDRALSRVSGDTPVAVVLFDDEVGQAVPTEQHDQPVSHALTPGGILAFGVSPPARA